MGVMVTYGSYAGSHRRLPGAAVTLVPLLVTVVLVRRY